MAASYNALNGVPCREFAGRERAKQAKLCSVSEGAVTLNPPPDTADNPANGLISLEPTGGMLAASGMVMGGVMAENTTYTEDDLRIRLSGYEVEYAMTSEEFLSRWSAGDLPITGAFFAWAGLCGRLGVPVRELA